MRSGKWIDAEEHPAKHHNVKQKWCDPFVELFGVIFFRSSQVSSRDAVGFGHISLHPHHERQDVRHVVSLEKTTPKWDL